MNMQWIRKLLLMSIIWIATNIPVFICAEISLEPQPTGDRIEQLFSEANRAYEQADFERAIEGYENILNYKVINPAVYFNLGNSYFKTNSLGKAILYYEKGFRLSPRDEDILENLTLARVMTVDRVDHAVPGLIANLLTTFYNSFSLNELALISLVAMISVIVFFSLLILTRSPILRRSIWYLTGFGIALLLIFSTTFYVKYDNYHNQTTAIVISPKLDAYPAPIQTTGDVAFTVHEGKKARVLQSREDWAEIELENGWKGWVNQGSLDEI
ncbi:MAG: hypothetical protein B6244_10740 [Candidatus Cloacimonetes bacterium 4572_55]|nr:MAG: hypothetical protein B6244_10740 [Candidatus Cloacimonetes bacterium 4572_55]